MFLDSFMNDIPPPPDHSPPSGMYPDSPPPPSPISTPTRVYSNPTPKGNRRLVPIWAYHSPPRPTKSFVPTKPQKARPQYQCPAYRNITRSHRPTYHNDSSVRRVFNNQAFLSPGHVSVLPSFKRSIHIHL
jgi:hypothetical protein